MKSNRVIFMTGATSGLGKASALEAAKKGATVIVLARNMNKGQALISEFETKYPEGIGKIEIIEGNLNSFKSVSTACEEIKHKYPTIDMIVNNAGIMNFEYKETIDSIEETLQVNVLAPILISHLLYDTVKKSNDSKIIFTSSALHQGEINFANLGFRNSFSSFKVYRQSKLAVILVCRLLASYIQHDQVGIYSQHPGIVRTNLGQDAGWFSKIVFYFMGKSPEKGSQTLTYLIETPNSALKSGEYYSDRKITKTTDESYDLHVAKKLLKLIHDLLCQYIKSESKILQLRSPDL